MGVPGNDDPGAPPDGVARSPVPAGLAGRPRVTELPDRRLIGRWRLLRADPSLEFAPNVRMEFLHGGRLRYAFDAGGAVQSVMLIYRVEGDMLVTDNPAASHLSSTRFWFGPGDVLAIDYAGAIAWFIREL